MFSTLEQISQFSPGHRRNPKSGSEPASESPRDHCKDNLLLPTSEADETRRDPCRGMVFERSDDGLSLLLSS